MPVYILTHCVHNLTKKDSIVEADVESGQVLRFEMQFHAEMGTNDTCPDSWPLLTIPELHGGVVLQQVVNRYEDGRCLVFQSYTVSSLDEVAVGTFDTGVTDLGGFDLAGV